MESKDIINELKSGKAFYVNYLFNLFNKLHIVLVIKIPQKYRLLSQF
jgi:hypothetical protein